MNIKIRTIPHEQQRYLTVGDWRFVGGEENPTALIITVSDMENPWYEYLVAQHELIEAMLCLKRGIKEKAVSDFDIAYETTRKEGDVSEPGNDPRSPYFKEHVFATTLERIMSNELNLNWEEYDEKVSSL